MSNLAWQILDTKTKIPSLFAESLLWQSKGNLNRAYSGTAAALGCDGATLKAALRVDSTFSEGLPFRSSDGGTYDAAQRATKTR